MVGLERRNTTFLLDRRCLVEYACITKKTCVGLRDVPGKGGVRLSALPPDLFFFFFSFRGFEMEVIRAGAVRVLALCFRGCLSQARR